MSEKDTNVGGNNIQAEPTELEMDIDIEKKRKREESFKRNKEN